MGLLQRIRDWSADREFNAHLRNVQSGDTITRIMGIQGFEKLGDERAIVHLVNELREPPVNHSAAKALVTLGWQPADDIDGAYFHACYWGGDTSKLYDSAELMRIARAGHAHLVAINLAREVAYCSNDYCKERAAKFLGQMGPLPDDAMRAMIAYIWLGNEGDERTQIACAESLGRIGDERVAADLEVTPVSQSWRAVSRAVNEAIDTIRARGDAPQTVVAEAQPSEPAATATAAAEIPPAFYCFVYSGNRSVIEKLAQVFLEYADDTLAGHFSVRSAYSLWEKHGGQEGAFDGTEYLNMDEQPIATLGDALGKMGVAANDELHMGFVAAKGEMYLRVHMVYQAMLTEAVEQGIGPFRLLVTESVEAAQALLDNFETVDGNFDRSDLASAMRK
jgi:hypothetical protein